MTPHRFSLEPMNFPELDARALMRVAAATGYECVSLTLLSAMTGRPDPLVGDESGTAETAAWMREHGLAMQTIECFNLTGESDVAAFAPVLACGATLGARAATAILWENPDRADALAKYRRLCDMAREQGIRVNIEFLPITHSMASLPEAVAFVTDADRVNAGIMVDLLHLMRSGGSIADLRTLDPALIGGAQLCDAPAERVEKLLMAEAGSERLDAGMGGLPVRDFVAALAADVVLGLEVPQHGRLGRISAEDRAREMRAAALRVYADITP